MKPEALHRPLHRSCGLTDCVVDALGYSGCGTTACPECGGDDKDIPTMNPTRFRCLICGRHWPRRDIA